MRGISLSEKFALYLILSALGLLMSAPFLYMVSMALASDATTIRLAFTLLPREFQWSNFVEVFGEARMGQYLLNSIKIAGLSVVGQVFSSSLVAYGFARLRAPGKSFLFILLLSTMMIPGEVTMIPQFVLFRNLHWLNTHLPLIVPAFFGGAFNIFLIRQFIMRVPTDLDESAKIDGLNPLGIYALIIIPLIKPVLAAVAILTFSWSWGWFMGPLIYLNDMSKIPLALAIQILSATTHTAGQPPQWNLVMVGALLLTLPMLLVFILGQKQLFEANLSSGSSVLKG